MAAAAGAAHAKRVAETAARIFGNWIGNGQRSGRKVLRQKMIGEEIASYYMEPIKDPLLEDPMEARRACCGLPLAHCTAVWSSSLPRLSVSPVAVADDSCPSFSVFAFRRKLKLDRLRRRGKSPPKKGEGKRASKK